MCSFIGNGISYDSRPLCRALVARASLGSSLPATLSSTACCERDCQGAGPSEVCQELTEAGEEPSSGARTPALSIGVVGNVQGEAPVRKKRWRIRGAGVPGPGLGDTIPRWPEADLRTFGPTGGSAPGHPGPEDLPAGERTNPRDSNCRRIFRGVPAPGRNWISRGAGRRATVEKEEE